MVYVEKGNFDVIEGSFVVVDKTGIRTHIPIGTVALPVPRMRGDLLFIGGFVFNGEKFCSVRRSTTLPKSTRIRACPGFRILSLFVQYVLLP